MCRRILLSLWTLAAAAGAYYLRMQQLSLSTPDSIYGVGLWGLLGASLFFAALLVIPEKKGPEMRAPHAVPLATVLQGSGALLLLVSGAWQLYQLYPALRSLAAVNAAALLLAGFGLFGGMKACCKPESKAGSLLLLSLAATVLHLVSAYMENCSDPYLWCYDMRMLFLGATAVAAGLLSDFVFCLGQRRPALIILSLTVILAGAALPSTNSFPLLLAVMGIAFTALGYLIVLLHGFEHRSTVTYELVEDPFSTKRIRTAATETPKEAEEAPAAEAVPSLPAEEPQPAPVQDDVFDLSRVDRLLLELGLDDDLN